MFSLTKRPETEIAINGQITKVNLAFNRVLTVFDILDNDDLTSEEKIDKCFDVLVTDIESRNVAEVIKGKIVETVMEYINQTPYGKLEITSDDNEDDTDEISPANSKPDFDYEKDAGAIYASFLSEYNIDLYEYADHMHWDRFKALFDNLSSRSAFNKIRSIRSDNISNYDMTSQEDMKRWRAVQELQAYYGLNEPEEEYDIADMEAELQRRQNLSKGGK